MFNNKYELYEFYIEAAYVLEDTMINLFQEIFNFPELLGKISFPDHVWDIDRPIVPFFYQNALKGPESYPGQFLFFRLAREASRKNWIRAKMIPA